MYWTPVEKYTPDKSGLYLLKLKEVAEVYDIDFSTVSDISRYKTWRHVQ